MREQPPILYSGQYAWIYMSVQLATGSLSKEAVTVSRKYGLKQNDNQISRLRMIECQKTITSHLVFNTIFSKTSYLFMVIHFGNDILTKMLAA